MNKAIVIFFAAVVSLLAVGCADSQKPSERIKRGEQALADSTATARVAFTRDNPYDYDCTPRVNVELNGVPFNMLWDTGATGTQISELEYRNMLKAGKIPETVGEAYVTVADGSRFRVPLVRVKDLTIRCTDGGEMKVYDVVVSVMSGDGAEMLLGQNVMKKLPRSSVNYNDNVIEFYGEE